MKYPYELSESRLSLLPRKEQNQYIYEHSIFFNSEERERAINEYRAAYQRSVNMYYQEMLNENADTSDPALNEELLEIAKKEAQYQAEAAFEWIDGLMQPALEEGGLTEDEYAQLSEYIRSELLKEDDSLNEATDGPDMTFWAKGLGKYLALGFTGIFAGMAGLILAGKTKEAIRQLEQYMNEIVDLYDDGRFKKRSLFGKVGQWFKNKLPKIFGSKNTRPGEHSRGSFRDSEEEYLGSVAIKAMILLKSVGFFDTNKLDEAVNEVIANELCLGDSGLAMFRENVQLPINNVANKI